MDGPEFIRQIGRSWEFFKQLTLDRTLIWKASLPVDEDFRRVALAPESFYAEIYRVGLSRSSYSFLLSDYSYFQFSWDSERRLEAGLFSKPLDCRGTRRAGYFGSMGSVRGDGRSVT